MSLRTRRRRHRIRTPLRPALSDWTQDSEGIWRPSPFKSAGTTFVYVEDVCVGVVGRAYPLVSTRTVAFKDGPLDGLERVLPGGCKEEPIHRHRQETPFAPGVTTLVGYYRPARDAEGKVRMLDGGVTELWTWEAE